MNLVSQCSGHIVHGAEHICTIVRCFYEGSTRDRQDEFVLDEYTIRSQFQEPLFLFIAPVSRLLGACSLETFLQALPERYIAIQTFKMYYGEAEIDGEKVFLMGGPFAMIHTLSYINGTLHTAAEVRRIFLAKRRSKFNEEILEAAQHHGLFIQTRTGGWRPYYEKQNEIIQVAVEVQEQTHATAHRTDQGQNT